MRWLLTLLAILAVVVAVGCARPGGELVAFPQTDAPANPPANTDEPDTSSGPTVMRTRFPVRATMAQINRTACSLQPTLVVNGVQQKVDMRIGGVTPCGTGGDVHVNVLVNATDRGREVVLELTVPTGASQQDTNDLKLGLRDVRTELERRIAALPPDVLVTDDGPPTADKPPTKHRRSSRVLAVAATLLISGGVVGVTALAFTGVGAAQSNRCCESLGWFVAGASTFLFGSAPALLGGIVTIITAGAMYASDD